MDLAAESAFRLGVLAVSPPDCGVVWPEGRSVLQPRVMQVLVVLAKAGGEVVSRDTLIQECWDGRVVGEDAITRVLVQLRHLSADLGGRAFELETIPRVGYRLTAAPVDAASVPARGEGLGRRGVMILGGLAAAAMAAGGGWLAYRGRKPEREPLTIAVMPFEDLSRDAKGSPVARGVAREVRNALSRVGGLRIIADTSSAQVASQIQQAQAAAQRLGADLLLTGSVNQSKGDVRVSLELVDPKAGAQIWTQTQTGQADDLFALLDAVSGSAIQALVGRIGPDRVRLAPAPRPRDPRAFLKVLAADDLLEQSRELRMTGQDGPGEDAAEQALGLINEALKIDPGDVGARVALATITRNGWTRTLAAQPLSQAKRAAAAADIIRQALVSDPNDPAALTALGDYYRRFEWRWKEAENLFRRAIAASPSLVEAHWSYGYQLGVAGRGKEGVPHAMEVYRLDPEVMWRRVAPARLLYTAGDRVGSLKRYDIELAKAPSNAFLVREIYLMHMAEGNSGALKRLARNVGGAFAAGRTPAPIALLLARTEAAVAALHGAPQALLAILDADVKAYDSEEGKGATREGRASVDLLYIYAVEYAQAGKTDTAIKLLARALAAGSLYWPSTLPYGCAEFPKPMRDDPRYAALWQSDPRLQELVASRRAGQASGEMGGPWTRTAEWSA